VTDLVRRRLWLGGVLLAVLVVVAAISLARSRSQGCTLPPPVPELPDRLRALGDFDRPFNVGVERDIEDVAGRAATALHPNLIGTSAERPVRVFAASADRHDALVVPLNVGSAPNRPSHAAGLVAFLLDCSGRAYYSAVQDVSAGSGSLPDFPGVTEDMARARLGGADVRLVYTDSPFRPVWRDTRSGHEVPAW